MVMTPPTLRFVERFETPAVPRPELATGNDNDTICTVPDEDRTLQKGHKMRTESLRKDIR